MIFEHPGTLELLAAERAARFREEAELARLRALARGGAVSAGAGRPPRLPAWWALAWRAAAGGLSRLASFLRRHPGLGAVPRPPQPAPRAAPQGPPVARAAAPASSSLGLTARRAA